jgi:hypothetical protein
MSKHTQKNWLLIITGFLLLSSGFILFISLREQFGFGTCAYNGVTYDSGDIITDSEESCFCNKWGKVECLPVGSSSNSLSDFVSTDLNFYYKFVNLLDTKADSKSVEIKDISTEDSKLSVMLERQTLCSVENVAPISVGFYRYDENTLTLTTMTSRDSSYSQPCVVENTYEITSKKQEFSSDFKIQYQTEELDILELNICISDGRLFVEGDIFKSPDQSQLCSCEEGQVVCGDSLE